MAKELYHYCSNEKCFSILNSRSIRLSDIQKSNDYRELSLFFPKILNYIAELYRLNPFPLECYGKFGEEALSELLELSFRYWDDKFSSGKFSNYVLCFSEAADSLSQWRGYANNGKGCCLGFSMETVERYCMSTNGLLLLKKVIYLSEEDIDDAIKHAAKEILASLNGLREWIGIRNDK